MRRTARARAGLSAAGAAALLGAACARAPAADRPDPRTLPRTASGFPARTLTIMAPANPGGGWDQMARLVQHVLVTERIVPGPVEVVNRGGAGGTIGLAELVTRHRRDPHTIMVGGGVMLGAIITHASPFGLTDTTPLARLVSEYEVIAVPAASPYPSLGALLEDLRRDPGAVTWGGGSAGGTDHMLVGLVAQAAGVDPRRVNYVAFTGGGEAAAAVMGGQVSAGVSGLGEWSGHAEAGRMRFLAVSAPRRLPGVGTPTLIESGLDVTVANWRCLVAPPGVVEGERAWMVAALGRMRETEAWREILRRNDWEDSFLAGDALARFIRAEHEATARILTSLGLGEAGQGYAVVGPYFFPGLVALGALVAGGLVAVGGRAPAGREPGSPGTDWRSLAASAGLLFVYLLLFETAGFLVATPPFLFLQARAFGSAAWKRDLAFAVVLTAVIWGLFRGALGISLPAGMLG